MDTWEWDVLTILINVGDFGGEPESKSVVFTQQIYLAFWLLWLLRGFLSNNMWGCSGICDSNGTFIPFVSWSRVELSWIMTSRENQSNLVTLSKSVDGKKSCTTW